MTRRNFPDKPLILAIKGLPGCGKTSLRSALVRLQGPELDIRDGSLAAPIREFVESLFDVTDWSFFKNTLYSGRTGRQWMQQLGDDWRSRLGDRVFTTAFIATIEPHVLNQSYPWDAVVVDDLRMPHELEHLREHFDVCVLHLLRDGWYGPAASAEELQHSTERDVDKIPADITLSAPEGGLRIAAYWTLYRLIQDGWL